MNVAAVAPRIKFDVYQHLENINSSTLFCRTFEIGNNDLFESCPG